MVVKTENYDTLPLEWKVMLEEVEISVYYEKIDYVPQVCIYVAEVSEFTGGSTDVIDLDL